MPSRLITPSQLSLFSISPVIGAWWQELETRKLFEDSKPAVSELDQQLFADGLRHEQVLLSKLEKEGRSIARLPGKQTEADYEATREAMDQGVEFIHQASLCNEEMRGSADLLKRIDRPSLLGEWSYIPIECKLASKPKTTFLVQASAYCELLTPLLGHRPDQFELYLGGGKFQPYGTDQFWAWYQLRCPAEFDVTVPTGNFGNIFAGYLAKKMGLPLGRLNLATNDNDILARFFRSGIYERGPVHFSLSPAMDIQVASNFERYLYFQFGGDTERVKTFMSGFQDNQTSTLEHLHGDFDWFQAGAVTDAETVTTIEKVFDQCGYLADPHTAVGIAIAEQYQRDDVPMVAVATAHPAKFVEAVGRALPQTPNHHPTLQALAGKETRRYDLAASEASLKTFIKGACT